MHDPLKETLRETLRFRTSGFPAQAPQNHGFLFGKGRGERRGGGGGEFGFRVRGQLSFGDFGPGAPLCLPRQALLKHGRR